MRILHLIDLLLKSISSYIEYFVIPSVSCVQSELNNNDVYLRIDFESSLGNTIIGTHWFITTQHSYSITIGNFQVVCVSCKYPSFRFNSYFEAFSNMFCAYSRNAVNKSSSSKVWNTPRFIIWVFIETWREYKFEVWRFVVELDLDVGDSSIEGILSVFC